MSRPDPLRRNAGPPVNERGSASFEDELEFHLDARSGELEAAGCSPEAARAQALREFGDREDARRYVARIERHDRRRVHWEGWMAGIAHDLRYAFRRLRRTPAFTSAVVLTLGLGIGINAAIFSVVYGVLLRPLPFPHPDQLYAVYSANRTANILQGSVSPVDLDDWRARRRQVADLGGYLFTDGSTGVDLTGRGEPRRLSAVFVTAGFLTTLGAVPELGRLPREGELVRGGPDHVVLLTDGFWGREFGRDRGVVGSAVTLSGAAYTVIGVLPPEIQFPAAGADVYIPYSTIPDSDIPRLRVVRLLNVVARARPGVSEEQVRAEMSAIAAGLATQFPEDQAWGATTVSPLADTIVAPVRNHLWILFAAAAFVLAMACANVVSLQLARALQRAQDLALSAALGASRSRAVGQLLIEGFLLSVAGAAVGLCLAVGGVSLLLNLADGQLPRAGGVRVDGVVLGFAVGAALIAGLVASLIPALRATRGNGTRLLRVSGRRGAQGSQPRLRGVLVVVEVAAALVLAVGAGLMGRSFAALLRVDPGFRPDHLVGALFTIDPNRHDEASINPPVDGMAVGTRFAPYYTEVIERVRALPGVVSAAAVKDAPFRGTGERIGFSIPGQPIPAGQDSPVAGAIHVSDGYFRTIGARMIDGREFTPRDRAGTPLVVVVNDAFARQFFPGARAVGQRLLVGQNRSIEIVGVVADFHQTNLAGTVQPTVYLDNLQNGRVQTTIVARTVGDPALMAAALRNAIWSVDPAQPIADVFTLNDAMGRSVSTPRMLLVLLGIFGALGFALGALGIYSLLASLVSDRRQEIGVRMALGASSHVVTRAIVWRGVSLAVVGVLVGLGGAFGLAHLLSSVLFGIKPLDAPTYCTMTLGLMAAAVGASWIPARRAARVDPALTLRAP